MAYPCGLRPESRHSALLGIHLESPNHIPLALIGSIRRSSDNTEMRANRPYACVHPLSKLAYNKRADSMRRMAEDFYARKLGFLINDVARLMRRRFDREAQVLGLTRAQWSVLFHLHRNEGVTQACLAQLMDIQPITLGRLIDRLEADGWAERRAHPSDRRARSLYLTGRAFPMLEAMQGISSRLRAEAVAGLPPGEVEHLLDMLVHIKSNLMAQEYAGTDKEKRA